MRVFLPSGVTPLGFSSASGCYTSHGARLPATSPLHGMCVVFSSFSSIDFSVLGILVGARPPPPRSSGTRLNVTFTTAGFKKEEKTHKIVVERQGPKTCMHLTPKGAVEFSSENPDSRFQKQKKV